MVNTAPLRAAPTTATATAAAKPATLATLGNVGARADGSGKAATFRWNKTARTEGITTEVRVSSIIHDGVALFLFLSFFLSFSLLS